MRRVSRAALLAVGVIAAAACGISVSGTGPTGTTPSDDAGEAGRTDSPADGPIADGPSDGGPSDAADAVSDAFACPNLQPPLMKNVGDFCIDESEVSITMFIGFAESDAAVGAPPVAGCEWKTAYTYADAGFNVSGLPAVVDWCDAWAYCHWAGKRLCGGIGGIKLPGPAEADDPKKSQWDFACTGGDPKHKYPYGDTYDASVCGGPLREATTGGGCEGAFPDVFDMSGNVAEWIDSCDSVDPAANCLVRGGSYLSTMPNQFACAGGPPAKRNTIPPATGFRCCAP